MDRISWRTRLARQGRFIVRWGWFELLSIAVVTLCSFFLHDSLSASSYQATLQVQVQIPASQSGLPTTNNTTAFVSGLLVSPSTLSLALPTIDNNKQFPEFSQFQLADLEGTITATPVTGTAYILLAATGATQKEAIFLVTTTYQAFLQNLHDRSSSLFNVFHASLTNELNHIQADYANSNASLQNLSAIGRTYSFQYRELSSLNRQQRDYISTINSLLLSLNSDSSGNDSVIGLLNSTPEITTQPPLPPTQPQRLILSPLVGFVMGLSGALLASRFSQRLPLRGEKREAILPNILHVIPTMALGRPKKGYVQVLQDASSSAVPLLLRLPYQYSQEEHPLRVISVSSPFGREGKSTVAATLAIAAANKGLRTVLVDANLQRPVLSTWFGIPNAVGLLEAIHSSSNGVMGISPIQNTSVTKLSIVPSGKAGLQGNVQLQVRELNSWIEQLRVQADLVIFDCASLLKDPNVLYLAALSDVTLLTVNALKSSTARVREAEYMLENAGLPFATVLDQAARDAIE